MDLFTAVTLNNGVNMPILGLGVYQSAEETVSAVLAALETGYRHIDTAAFYGNEAYVGQAVRESGLDREELFITTKMWNVEQSNGTQREAFEQSLKSLGLSYVDLYLIHWPIEGKIKESWKVMEDIYASGRAKAIGVSNFEISDLNELLDSSSIVPAVNQIEIHPGCTRKALIAYCKERQIACEAWSPLGRGEMFENNTIREIAETHGKSPAQVMLRWEVQQGIITIPKSVNPERIRQNSMIFDFKLTEEEMNHIDSL